MAGNISNREVKEVAIKLEELDQGFFSTNVWKNCNSKIMARHFLLQVIDNSRHQKSKTYEEHFSGDYIKSNPLPLKQKFSGAEDNNYIFRVL